MITHARYYSDDIVSSFPLLEYLGFEDILLEEETPDRFLWDVRATLDGRPVTLELKFDWKAKDTGNIALEWGTFKWGKFYPSQREADYWVVVTNEEAFVIPTSTVIELLQEESYPWRLVKNVVRGYCWFSCIRLVPVEDIRTHAETVMSEEKDGLEYVLESP